MKPFSTRFNIRKIALSLPFVVGIALIVLSLSQSAEQVVHANMPNDAIHQGISQTEAENDYFVTSPICADCHTDIQDAGGNDISYDVAWRSSIMANAANDPYWLASVQRETLANPAELTPVIQDICANCHMPMARVTANTQGDSFLVLGEGGYTDPNHELHAFANEGVSCTVCHQILPDNFGEEESFDGGYLIDTETPIGERAIYGPFPVERGVRNMSRGSGFIPVESEHITSSEMCATCHNLVTPFLDENGEIAGTIHEQSPYTEWLYSDYAESTSCVDCHMLRAEGEAMMVDSGGDLREGLALHHTLGGNNFILTMLSENGLGENIGATPEDFATAIELNEQFMSTQAATLSLENVAVENGELTASVVIQNMAGHKLPTSYPSRRAWVHLTVTDSAGAIVFESGGYQEDGLIMGNDNDADGSTYEPHYVEITSEDEVQIYEAIMVDTADVPTTTLLRGARYIKDNRILPLGYDEASAPEEVSAAGVALEDADFVGGSDTVHYRIAVEGTGSYTVTVEVLYQAISYRWAMSMETFAADDTTEISTFLDLYNQTPNLPVVIGETSTVTD